jgi:hypothetical protein
LDSTHTLSFLYLSAVQKPALPTRPHSSSQYFNAGLAYWLNRQLGVEWCVAGPSALIGASNFFELERDELRRNR